MDLDPSRSQATDDLVNSATAQAFDGLDCLSNLFASADYRAHLLQVYAKRALEEARERVHR